MRSAAPWLTACVIVALDRLTKMAILDRLQPGSWVPVFPGFALTHVHNRGIAFSLFADGGWLTRVVLHLVIVSAVVLIAWLLVRHNTHSWLSRMGFGLILGGAIGNLIDRVIYGWVVDFIHLWIRVGDGLHSWPDFNVADSAITVGACCLVLHEVRGNRGTTGEGTTESEDASGSD